MKNKQLITKLFIVVAIIQLAVPLYMVWRWEDILKTGQQYTWVTAPVDPYDAFRGRYVDLRFKENSTPIVDNAIWDYGQTAYALIQKDQNGYAFISGISALRPEGNSYVKVNVSYVENHIVHFELPFKRYYMQEELAPEAEDAYRSNVGTEATVSIRMKNGYGVIEQLYIGNQTIYDYLRNKQEQE